MHLPILKQLNALGLLSLLLSAFSCPSVSAQDKPTSAATRARVHLRIEGSTSTIFDGDITTTIHEVRTASGGRHKCDGTNGGVHSVPGVTFLGALDDAARNNRFSWDGPYLDNFEDFMISRVADLEEKDGKFWGSLLNGRFTELGGCAIQVQQGDELLIAYDAFAAREILRLEGSGRTAKRGRPYVVTVTDQWFGKPVKDAVVYGKKTGEDGKVTLVFNQLLNDVKLKAEKEGAVRSNEIKVEVELF